MGERAERVRAELALQLVEADYASPQVQELVAEVQAEYVVRYGGPDETPLAPEQFAPPDGAFLLAVAGGRVVGCAGLRSRGTRGTDDVEPGAVELKRMYVRAPERRRGYARALLAAAEERARALGARRLVLETGTMQPEAVALYRAAGYAATAPYGHYAGSPSAIHLAKEL